MAELRLAGLVKRFGGLRAVDDVSLAIGNGEFVSLLGPSGCGKTTTLKLIAGFETADAGRIEFDGQDVAAVPAERRDIGMVFQNYALFPHMTVAGNLAFGLEMRKIAKPQIAERVARVLEMVQLDKFADRYPRQLSGGQQQRVALGRALVIEPRILLLDEPLANLDAKLRDEMRNFIRSLQRRVGITTIYVTHDQAEAMTMSDRVVVMFGGRVAQAASPTDLYERPATQEVARFVGQANLIPGLMAAAAGGPVAQTALGDIPVDPAAGFSPGARVKVLLRPEALTLAAGEGARVLSRVYTGNAIEYRVAMADGSEVQVITAPNQRFADGDAIRLVLPAERLWPLDDAA